MATRLLLTLLALMTGLAAQLAPAQARNGGGTEMEIGALATASVGQRQSVSPSGARDWRDYCDRRPGQAAPYIEAPSAIPIAAVRIGIDRART